LAPVTVEELLRFLDEEEDEAKRKMARTLIEVRRSCRPEFADRMEKYMLEHDLLPLGRKAN
jgi:hypothetical protein